MQHANVDNVNEHRLRSNSYWCSCDTTVKFNQTNNQNISSSIFAQYLVLWILNTVFESQYSNKHFIFEFRYWNSIFDIFLLESMI